jgi:hypothetical protein
MFFILEEIPLIKEPKEIERLDNFLNKTNGQT